MRSDAGKNLSFFKILFILFSLSIIQLSANPLKMLQEKKLDVNEGELLELKTDAGDVDIKTWSSNSVYVKILGNKKAQEEMKFEVKKTSKGVQVIAKKDNSWFGNWNGVDVRYEIKVPDKFNVDIVTSGGDIDLVDLIGEVNLNTSGGDITAENIEGNIIGKTSGGDVGLADVYGNIDASTSGGDIRIKGSEGQLKASTSGGDIQLDYRGENKGISAYTSGGDIVVTIPSDFKADVYLKTSGGDIECNFEARVEEVNDSKFVGKLHGGGPEFVCKTSGGDIEVKEAE